MRKKLLCFVAAGCVSLSLISCAFPALGFSFKFREEDFIPNDTLFSNQWALHNTGQRIRLRKGMEDVDMDIPEAWQYIAENIDNREDVIVAILDSGVNYEHVDLKDSILKVNGVVKGYNFVRNNSDVLDDNGHGTMMAGIIAASKDNFRGIAGINDRAKIMPIKVLDATGTGNIENLKKGIMYAVDNGADVINMSLVGAYDASVSEAVKHAYSHGAIVVSASGSDNMEIGGNTLKSPIDNENGVNAVIGVSAINSNEERYSQSNYGQSIDISAPGESIVTAYYRTDRSYVYASGTSLAAANAAGVVSLLKSCFPNVPNSKIISVLIESAQNFSSAKNGMGAGIINAFNAAVSLNGEVLDPVDPDPRDDFRLIRLKDALTVFLVRDNIKRGIPRLEVFEAWGFSFSDVEVADSQQKLDAISTGKLLGFPKGYVVKGSPLTVFEIQDNDVARAFSNPDAFLARGHKWLDIKQVSDYEILNSYTVGEPIVQ